ncbi:MAG: hypothetical protein KDA41_00025 [Planctomycetales bacterium]|nr:hypothetical protein [Planctomycetales bacterium]
MKIFLAGIMQGSHLAMTLHNQTYRERLKSLLQTHMPEAEVYDPLADHADSLDYDAEQGRQVFMKHNRMCREVDVLIAVVPEASMGTAIEMWEAHQAGRIVISVSPLAHNWAVRFLSDLIFADEDALAAALSSGALSEQLNELRRQRQAMLQAQQ